MEIFQSKFFTSFIIPILVAVATSWFIHIINRKKYRKEVEKLIAETDRLKRDFQPHVLSTLQEIQSSIFELKLTGLNKLVEIKNNVFSVENPIVDGEYLYKDIEDFYSYVFSQFSKQNLDEYNRYFAKYGYLFPKRVRRRLSDISYVFYEAYERYERNGIKPDYYDDSEISVISNLDTKFKEAIESIRKDLHLDDSFIHDFIKKYKK